MNWNEASFHIILEWHLSKKVSALDHRLISVMQHCICCFLLIFSVFFFLCHALRLHFILRIRSPEKLTPYYKYSVSDRFKPKSKFTIMGLVRLVKQAGASIIVKYSTEKRRGRAKQGVCWDWAFLCVFDRFDELSSRWRIRCRRICKRIKRPLSKMESVIYTVVASCKS